MKYVYKYPIPRIMDESIEMPVGAKIVRFDLQRGHFTLWAEVPETDEVENRFFTVFGTGFLIPDDAVYIGTTMQNEGDFVWHCYEVTP